MEETLSLKLFDNLRFIRFLGTNISTVPELIALFLEWKAADKWVDRAGPMKRAIDLLAPILDSFPMEETLLADADAVRSAVKVEQLRFDNDKLFQWVLDHADEFGTFLMLILKFFGKV